MYSTYIKNPNNIVFWYSPKCGCTFIRRLYMYLTDNLIENNEHIDYKTLDKDIKLTHILFVRNPYKRIVSAFLDCYVQNKRYTPISQEMTFTNVLEDIIVNEYKNIDKLHFSPMLSNEHLDLEFDYMFDIENIDYPLLSELFNKYIGDDAIELLRDTKHVIKYKPDNIENAENIPLSQLIDIPIWKSFYSSNGITKKLVDIIYETDFEFLKLNDFEYSIK